MADVGEVRARVVLDTSGLERDADRAKEKVRGIGDEDSKLTFKGLLEGDKAAQTLSKTLTGTGKALTTAVTVPMAAIGAASIKAAVDIDTGLTDVRKTVDGTEEDFQRLKDAAIEFSQTNAVGAAELLSIESLGAQLGYTLDVMSNGKTEVQEFGEVVSGLDIATNMSAEQAGSELAQFFNIMGESKEMTENYGSTIVGLGNSFATTESDISAMSMRIAGAGKNIGLSSADVLGLATALSSLGIEAEAGGTAISTVMSNVDKSVALQNENLQTWAETAHMSAEEFTRAWQDDAVGALDAVFKGMAQNVDEGGNLAVMLEELGISSIRQTDMMKRLANSGDLMSRAVAQANDEWERNDALSNEVANRNDSLAAKFEMLKNKAIALGEKIGGPLADALLDVVDQAEPLLSWVSGVVQGFADMDSAGQRQVLTWAAMAMAIGPFLTAAGKLVAAIPSIASGLSLLGSTLGPVGIGFTAFTGLLVAATAAEQYRLDVMSGGSDADRERRQRMEELAESARNLKSAQEDMLASSEKEASDATWRLDYYQGRLDRLDELADASGRVAEADRDEAQAIIDQVNGALGTEIEMRDGVIQKLDETKQSIEQLIEQKRAEAMMGAFEGAYEQSLVDQVQAQKDAAEAAGNYQAAVERLQQAQVTADAAYQAYQDDPVMFGKQWADASNALALAQQEFANTNAAMTENAGNLAAATMTTQQYEAAMTAMAGGDMQRVQEILSGIGTASETARQQAEQSVAGMVTAFGSMGGATWGAVQQVGTSFNELAVALTGAGVSVQDLASINDQAFASMLRSCDGNVDKMAEKIGQWNALEAEGKSPTVDANGNVISGGAKKSVDDFNRSASGAKDASTSVEASGNVTSGEAKKQADDTKTSIDSLEDKDVNATANVFGKGDVDSLRGSINALQDKTVNVSVNTTHTNTTVNKTVNEGGSASGGVSPGAMIPRHASGGMAGIVTSDTLTNYGWVGEDGAEAIVPLTNKRYIRPFALAVAQEVAKATSLTSLLQNDPVLRSVGWANPQGMFQAASMLWPGGQRPEAEQSGADGTTVYEDHRTIITVEGVSVSAASPVGNAVTDLVEGLRFEMGM